MDISKHRQYLLSEIKVKNPMKKIEVTDYSETIQQGMFETSIPPNKGFETKVGKDFIRIVDTWPMESLVLDYLNVLKIPYKYNKNYDTFTIDKKYCEIKKDTGY